MAAARCSSLECTVIVVPSSSQRAVPEEWSAAWTSRTMQ